MKTTFPHYKKQGTPFLSSWKGINLSNSSWVSAMKVITRYAMDMRNPGPMKSQSFRKLNQVEGRPSSYLPSSLKASEMPTLRSPLSSQYSSIYSLLPEARGSAEDIFRRACSARIWLCLAYIAQMPVGLGEMVEGSPDDCSKPYAGPISLVLLSCRVGTTINLNSPGESHPNLR